MTWSLANYEELDGDTATDLALAVDEACTVLIAMAEPGTDLVLVEDPRARELNVRVSTICDEVHVNPGSVFLSGFSRRVLEALTHKVGSFVEDADFATTGSNQPVLGISLTIRRRWAAASG
ncbi:anti-sigma factor [Mycobacterium sp. DL440]|uniref:anti-sigma factor n=1 Tax=Mycobacterium sp. DL440 TaxID=2675523 RepID=UPI00141F4A9F|nr:anti-sigma factor [Mycobacterium sp. DL440]